MSAVVTIPGHYWLGYVRGEAAGANTHLGMTSAVLDEFRVCADNALTRAERAYWLGALRGFRAEVRTLLGGRWGT